MDHLSIHTYISTEFDSHRQTVTETDVQYKAVSRTDLEQCIENTRAIAGGRELGHEYPMLVITRCLRSLGHTGYDADQHMDTALIYHPNFFAAQVSESANTIQFAFIIIFPPRGKIFARCYVY